MGEAATFTHPHFLFAPLHFPAPSTDLSPGRDVVVLQSRGEARRPRTCGARKGQGRTCGLDTYGLTYTAAVRSSSVCTYSSRNACTPPAGGCVRRARAYALSKKFFCTYTQGNELFARGKLLAAIDAYTEAYTLCPQWTVPLVNRALCQRKVPARGRVCVGRGAIDKLGKWRGGGRPEGMQLYMLNIQGH